MVEVYNRTGGNVIAVEECDPAETDKYGIVGVGETVGDAFRITGMVEKPKPAKAPSNLYINGRYILQPGIFDLLGTPGARRRQRDPAHRRHAPPRRDAALLRLPLRAAGPSIAAPSSASSPPTSRWRLKRDDLAAPFREELREAARVRRPTEAIWAVAQARRNLS